MFWLDNLNELFKPILYPNINMSLDEKINANYHSIQDIIAESILNVNQ